MKCLLKNITDARKIDVNLLNLHSILYRREDITTATRSHQIILSFRIEEQKKKEKKSSELSQALSEVASAFLNRSDSNPGHTQQVNLINSRGSY